MDDEIKSIKKSETWELTELPRNIQPIGVKWVFKKKMNAQGKLERYKARLVAKGYKQKMGLTMMKSLPRLQEWKQFDFSSQMQHNSDGRYTRWM